MNELTAVENRTNQYLDDVREQLSGLSQDEIESIIDDLHEHIDTALLAHGEQPTLENVEAVLAEMDAPESFAPDLDDTKEVVPKVSRTAILGAVILPLGILMAIVSLMPVSSATFSAVDGVTSSNVPESIWWRWPLQVTILLLGIISPFATTILGFISISQIRASKGKLIGKPLALIDALFYPILVFDGLLIAFLFVMIAAIPDGYLALTEGLTMLSYMLVIIIDVIIGVIAWHKIR
jgi:hypothetical protein